MTTSRHGFSRERHPGLKLLITGASLATFAVGWLGLGRAHDPAATSVQAAAGDELAQVAAAAQTLAPPVQSSGVPLAPTRTPVPTTPTPAPASPAASPTVSGAAPKPTSTLAAKKKSRAS